MWPSVLGFSYTVTTVWSTPPHKSRWRQYLCKNFVLEKLTPEHPKCAWDGTNVVFRCSWTLINYDVKAHSILSVLLFLKKSVWSLIILNWLGSPFSVEFEPRINAENMLEERDPQYDDMLNQMVGRIRTKPGGKLEMGEVSFWKPLFFLL